MHQRGLNADVLLKTIRITIPACIEIYMEAEGINNISSLKVLYVEMFFPV